MPLTNEQLFIPSLGEQLSEQDVWRWYRNIVLELSQLQLDAAERDSIVEYYVEAGLLNPRKATFFRRHFSVTVEASLRFLFEGKGRPRILDLGCGTGTQSILFALLGAEVLALDMDSVALGILRKRQDLYERLSGRKLQIEVHCENTLQFDYAAHGPFDGVFSLFAFNMMQPSGQLVDRIFQAASADMRICILDGNNRSWLARTVPSRRRKVWSPADFRQELERRGMCIVTHQGGISLPPPAWWLGSWRLLSAVDDVLNRNWLAPISHLIMATRRG